jgi:delta 1-pyrroline-5-carboxylate dehydrogenase
MSEEQKLQKLRAMFRENPDLLETLTGKKLAGRPTGAPNKNKLEAGKELHIVQEEDEQEEEQVTPISLTKAKQLLKAKSKPRQYSEEHKQKMIEILAAGREKRKQKLEELKKLKEQESKKVVVKKFIIKERKRKQPTSKRQDSDLETQPDESNTFTETDDTDHELYKKLKRKERVMKKLNELQELAKPKGAVQTQVKPRYSLFY